MMGSSWTEFWNWMNGARCPLCAPRPKTDPYKIEIAQLTVSTLYLDRDQRFHGYSVLIFDPRHATGIEQLTSEEYKAFTDDLHHAAKAVHEAFRPNLMNYASLGNGIPHVHWHIILRYENDPRWGYPVWVTLEAPQKVLLSDPEYESMVDRIRSCLQ
ncbi:MAG: HIT family protein [Herpetosiphonaceae bacterium]|nr:HIT family protein [Herpetosiphonaceae bacterium]